MRIVLFDMDGVVIDSEPLYERVQKQGLAQYGIHLDQSDYLSFKGLSESAVFDILERNYGVRWNRNQVRRESRELLLQEFRANLVYMDGFPEILGVLSGSCKFGLVTSTSRDFLTEVDKILPVTHYFQEIVAGGDTLNTKPHPDPYREIMLRMKVSPAQTVVIEDSVNGIHSARAAGAAVIGLSATYPCEELSDADLCVPSLKAITLATINTLFNDRASANSPD